MRKGGRKPPFLIDNLSFLRYNSILLGDITVAYIFPKNLVAGFNQRGKTTLAFITYMDAKNVLRSYKSWAGWKDSSPEKTFVNEAMTGFVINKNVRRDYHFGGAEYIRVWHPLNFEFEISTAMFERLINFVDISKGEIMTPCVLGWDGPKVELISTLDPLFDKCTENAVYNTKSKDLPVLDFELYKAYDFKGQRVAYCGFGKVHTSAAPNYEIDDVDRKYPFFMDLTTFELFQPKTRIKYMRHTDITMTDDEKKQYDESAEQCFYYDIHLNKFEKFGIAENPKFFNSDTLYSYVANSESCNDPLEKLRVVQKNTAIIVGSRVCNNIYSMNYKHYKMIIYFDGVWYDLKHGDGLEKFDINTINYGWTIIRYFEM